MSGADLLEDGFPHGTTAGFDRGCKSAGGCPGKDGELGQTCATAKSRSRMEFRYGKAVANGREVEFVLAEQQPVTKVLRAPAVDPDIVVAVDEMEPRDVGQRVAMERTLQDRRDRVEVDPEFVEEPVPLAQVPADDGPAPVEPTPAPPKPRTRPTRQKSAAVSEDVLDLLDEGIKAMAEVLIVIKNTADEIRDQRRALLRREAARNRTEQS